MVKLTDFFAKEREEAELKALEEDFGKVEAGVVVKEEPKEEAKPAGEKRSQIMLGGLVGYVYENGPATNLNSLAGGKVIFERASVDGRKHLEVIGKGAAYSINYLIPSVGSSVREQELEESSFDAQVNYKDLYSEGFLGGDVFSSVGVRGIFLNNQSAGDSLLGLRGGVEYIREVSQKLKGKLDFGLTAKVLGGQGQSILGALTSALDFGLEIAYDYSPDKMLSLNYESDALVFNQENVRYFNSLTVKNGWRL
ncbi:MAG: hypothetical protein KJ811_03950 [Candidatus Margulisbacteria bacterium]|nr:hypothetical protein [Candidatus Margulisiibacteriota bacterium]